MTLAYLALAWFLGVAAAAFTGADPAGALAASGLLGLISFLLRPRPATLGFIAAGAVLIFAASWRYDSTVPEPGPITRFNCDTAAGVVKDACQTVRLRAVVAATPDAQGSSRVYRVNVREVLNGIRWEPESGDILIRTPLYPEYKLGNLLEVEGKLEHPPVLDDFDYREYLMRRGVGSVADYPKVRFVGSGHAGAAQSTLTGLRLRLSDSLADALPEPEASLATGILFGMRSNLPRDLKDDMNATGTSHLVAVSGQNIVLLAGILITLLAGVVGRRNAAWIALAGVVFYAVLVGGQASVIRAAIMGALYVIAIVFGRQNTAWIALALAAALMTAHDPQTVHDVSFQLSFAATLGLIVLVPIVNAHVKALFFGWPSIRDLPLVNPTLDIASMTIAAIVFTLPITAINFHRISVVAPFANLLTVPAFLAVAFTSAVASTVGLLLPGDTGFTAWFAVPPAAYMIGVIHVFADLPLAFIELRGIALEHAVVYYSLLFATIWWLARRTVSTSEPTPLPMRSGHRRLLPATALASILGLASILLWLAIAAPQSGRLTVTLLDVGQGEAILIQTPEGHRVLIDGGPSGEAITAALGRHLPFHDDRIDLVVLTHPQADHLAGLLTVMDRYDVRSTLTGSVAAETATYDAWIRATKNTAAPTAIATGGQTIDLGGGARLAVLAPPAGAVGDNLNTASVVIRLTMGEASFLLTGDIDEEAEARLIRTGTDLQATVLKVAHHGSKTSTSADLVDRVQPSLDLISAGEDNPFGHPAQQILDRLAGDLILRTDVHGDITVSTDGHRLWVVTKRD